MEANGIPEPQKTECRQSISGGAESDGFTIDKECAHPHGRQEDLLRRGHSWGSGCLGCRPGAMTTRKKPTVNTGYEAGFDGQTQETEVFCYCATGQP